MSSGWTHPAPFLAHVDDSSSRGAQAPVTMQTAAVVSPAVTAETALRTELPMLMRTVGGCAANEIECTFRCALPIDAVILMAWARIAARRAASAAAAGRRPR